MDPTQSPPRQPAARNVPGRRWLSIALRSGHLAGVVVVAVGLLGAGQVPAAGSVLMFATGAALFALDWWRRPGLWREVAGAFVIAKLLLVLAMIVVPAIAAALFWIVLVASSVVSHAPRALRHRRIGG